MFSQTSEYALRAIAQLAQNPNTPQTSTQISAAMQIPLPYLSKILQNLVKADLIEAHRGRNGGFILRKPPAELTVYDVIQVVDPLKRIRTCPLHLAAHASSLCPLHKRLDDALAQVEKTFRETTIAEVVETPAKPV